MTETQNRPTTLRELLLAVPQHPEYVSPLSVRLAQQPRAELPAQFLPAADFEAQLAAFINPPPMTGEQRMRFLMGAGATRPAPGGLNTLHEGARRLMAGRAFLVDSPMGSNPLAALSLIVPLARKQDGDRSRAAEAIIRSLGLDAVIDFGNESLRALCAKSGVQLTVQGISALETKPLAHAIAFGLSLTQPYLPYAENPDIWVSALVLQQGRDLGELAIDYLKFEEQGETGAPVA